MVSTYLDKLRHFNRDVRLYLISWAMVGFNHMGIINVLFNLYLLRLGHGPKLIGAANGAAWIAYSAFCLPAGTLGKRWSSRTLMINGMVIITLGVGLTLINESLPPSWQPGWIIAFYSLTWAGAAFYMVNSLPFLTHATSVIERNHAFAFRTAINSLSGFIGSLVAGILPGIFASFLGSDLDQPGPYRYPIWIACIIYGCATIVLFRTRKTETSVNEGNDIETLPQDNPRAPRPYRLIAIISVTMLLVTAGSATIQNYFNVYMDTDLSVSVLIIGSLSAVKQLLSVLLALAAPLLITKWGKERTLLVGFILRTFSLLPIALIPHWTGAGIGYILSIAIMSLTLPTLGVYQQESVAPEWRALMSGAVNTAIGISGAALAFIGANVITTWGYRQLFLLSAVFVGAGSLIFWLYVRSQNVPHVQDLDAIS